MMKKKQYETPVCQVTETDACTMLAASVSSHKVNIEVDNEEAESYFYGDVNKNDFEDIAW